MQLFLRMIVAEGGWEGGGTHAGLASKDSLSGTLGFNRAYDCIHSALLANHYSLGPAKHVLRAICERSSCGVHELVATSGGETNSSEPTSAKSHRKSPVEEASVSKLSEKGNKKDDRSLLKAATHTAPGEQPEKEIMYLFLSDETNTTQSITVEFLIFGAMVIPIKNAPAAVKEVSEIRRYYGYPSDSEFKFDSRSRPNGMSQKKFNKAKGAVLDLAAKHGMRFMAYVVHHKIAANRKLRQRALFGLKTLLGEFDLFLSREKASGMCAVDRFDSAHSVLSDILIRGVDPVGDLGKYERQLSNIWLYSVTSISCSHLCSVCDIVLGTFRYCINTRDKTDVAEKLYPRVRKLFIHRPKAPAQIEDWGLFLRPKEVEIRSYAKAYDRLRTHLQNLE